MKTISVPYQEMGCERNECFTEVRKVVAERGGRLVYSWIVWEDRFWFTLLHHALWLTPQNELICITPQRIHNSEFSHDIEGNRNCIIDEGVHPIWNEEHQKWFALPARHIPKLNEKWCVAVCKALDEEMCLTHDAVDNTAARTDKVQLALESNKKANYWIGRGTKGNCYIPLNRWLYDLTAV